VKIVGKRRVHDDLTPISPEEAFRRATVLQAQAELLNPYPRRADSSSKPKHVKIMSAGARRRRTRASGNRMGESAPLLRVCKLLNEADAEYLICGAQACILHGLIRTTEDGCPIAPRRRRRA